MIRFWFAMVLILSVGNLYAQDPLFSQYYANPQYINPALTGIEGKNRLSFQHRDQWSNQAANYTTSLATYEFNPSTQSAIGIQMIHDVAGDNILQNSGLHLAYRQSFQISRNHQINASAQAGIVQRSLNVDNLVFEDQLSLEGVSESASNENISNQSRWYSDYSAGIALMHSKYYAGLAVHHLTQPDQSFVEQQSNLLSMKYTLHGGLKLNLNHDRARNSFYSPNLIIQKQGESEVVSIGNYFSHNGVTAGMWYRVDRAFIVALGYELENFRIGYSADINTNYYPQGGISHEISLSLTFQTNHSNKRRLNPNELVFCPTF